MNRHNPNRLRTPALWVALALAVTACGKEDKSADKATRDQPPASQPEHQTAANPTPVPNPHAQPATNFVQTTTPPPAPAKPLSDLQSLVAPIALYPDPLLAELLVASTYPLEVVQAARWLEAKPDLAGLKDKEWDASIIRLAEVPQVLKMMNNHLDWTTQLGNTFLAKPDELMNAIQDLRRIAKQSDYLKDTPEQKISTKTEEVREVSNGSAEGGVNAQPAVYKKEVVYIEPAKPDTLYVPQYKPEVAYQAPLAPPPVSSASYSADTGYSAPAPTTVNNYYPTTTTNTSSTSNDLMTFGMGALAGGLLTWGIMEWTHHDDYYYGYRGGYYYPPVSHYYGGAVCRYGNCWNSGGNWNRNNIYNRNTNISGNEINIDRSRTFNQEQLANLKGDRQPWNHDPGHRLGATYPSNVRDRLGQLDRPGLAGGRPGSAQTLPADVRGFAGAGDRLGQAQRPQTLPADGRGLAGAGDRLGQGQRPSTDQIRQSLSQGTRLQESKLGSKLPDRQGQGRPATSDMQQRLTQSQRPNALEGLRESGGRAKAEQLRGAESRMNFQDKLGNKQNLAGRERPQAAQNFQPKREMPQQRPAQRTASQGGRDFSQARTQQKRIEAERPSAFEGVREQGRTQNFSQRGAASRESMAGRFQGGGGLQNRPATGGFQGGGGLQNRPSGGFQGGGGRFGGGGGGFQGGGARIGGGGGGFQGGGGRFGGGGGGGGFRGRR